MIIFPFHQRKSPDRAKNSEAFFINLLFDTTVIEVLKQEKMKCHELWPAEHKDTFSQNWPVDKCEASFESKSALSWWCTKLPFSFCGRIPLVIVDKSTLSLELPTFLGLTTLHKMSHLSAKI